jgi:hypothetical protein
MEPTITKHDPHPENVNFLQIIHTFFSNVKTYQDGTDYLKKHMNKKIYDYSLFDTRKIFYSLIIYKFGKELQYPEILQTSARQLILFVLQTSARQLILFILQTNDDTEKDPPKETEKDKRKKIFKEFLNEFEKFKKEDFKNYMYELAIQYNQLAELIMRLTEEPEWTVPIRNLQDKILDQVTFSKGEQLFEECLNKLGKLKQEIIKEHLVNAYWDIMLEELSSKKYEMMMKNYLLIKKILLEMRDDEDTKEILDEKYIQQLLDNDLFTNNTLISQVEFIYHKMKIYGIPIYDKLIDKSKNNLIQEIHEKGTSPEMITNVFKKILPLLQSYIEIIRIYRQRINKSKMEK